MWERINSCPNEGSLTASDPWDFGGLKPLEKAPKPTRGGLVPTWNSRDRHSRYSHGGENSRKWPKNEEFWEAPEGKSRFGAFFGDKSLSPRISRKKFPREQPRAGFPAGPVPVIGDFPLKSWECPSGSVTDRSQPPPKGFSVPKLGF